MDIFLPDFKYWEDKKAARFLSGAQNYPELTWAAVQEMHRQVGVAREEQDGIIRRGLMIRHLVMPNRTAGSQEIMAWIAGHLPKDTYVNIMAQYRPLHKAFDYPKIARKINRKEYREVVQKARDLGLENLDVQGFWWLG